MQKNRSICLKGSVDQEWFDERMFLRSLVCAIQVKGFENVLFFIK